MHKTNGIIEQTPHFYIEVVHKKGEPIIWELMVPYRGSNYLNKINIFGI